MNAPESLFRPEALEAKKVGWMGEILLARPVSLGVLVCAALGIFFLLVLFLTTGEYTRKERVVGQVQPSRGAARLYSPAPGRIVEKLVHEGQFVKQGQTLYVISIERITSKGGAQLGIATQIAEKKANLQRQLAAQQGVQEESERALRNKLADLLSQRATLEKELALQRERVALSEATVARFTELSQSRFISQAQLSERQQDRLDQVGRLMSIERAQQNLTTELRSVESALKSAPLSAAAQIADLRRELAELDQEAVMNEAQRQIVVAAVRDGWATAVLGEIGQTVSPEIPLMSVLPPDGRLEAHLYVPSRAIGFLQRGQMVRLRYDAFPYQKFGQHQGRVEAISNVALAPGELRLLDMAPEMLYRVKVRLDSTSITAYGKQYPLQEGMKFEADVLLDTRKLYEWLLEPLYSVTGKL